MHAHFLPRDDRHRTRRFRHRLRYRQDPTEHHMSQMIRGSPFQPRPLVFRPTDRGVPRQVHYGMGQ
jgi:hypothetical protein